MGEEGEPSAGDHNRLPLPDGACYTAALMKRLGPIHAKAVPLMRRAGLTSVPTSVIVDTLVLEPAVPRTSVWAAFWGIG